jgi:hypothetical protein
MEPGYIFADVTHCVYGPPFRSIRITKCRLFGLHRRLGLSSDCELVRAFVRSFFRSFVHQWLYSPLLGSGRFFSFLIIYTVGRTPWTGDEPVPRHLPTQTHNKRTQISHALSVIRTHDSSVRASKDSSCPRQRGHCYR